MSIFNKAVLSNSLWMMAEKVISIFGVIFVTAFVAKYIGPRNFGKLTFAASIFAIVQTIAMFGLENILFQKISKNKKLGEKLIKSTHLIRNTIYFILAPLVLLWVYLSSDFLTFIFSIASCISIFFALHDVYGIYFNAILKSKINAIFNTIGLAIAFFVRYMIPYFELDVIWLVIPIILTTFLPFVFKYFYYHKVKETEFSDYAHNINIYRVSMIQSGKKLVLYSLSISIFTQTSQLFLGWQSKYDLGIYMVAVTLGNSFYFIFTALISSFMVKVYAEQSREKNEQTLFELQLLIVVISIMAGLFFYLFGEKIIELLYGKEYLKSAKLVNLMVLVCAFAGVSTVAEKYLLKFNAYNYLQKKTNILLFLNIFITFFGVKLYGLQGAVYAILITVICSTTILNYFHKDACIKHIHLSMFSLKRYRKLFKI